MIRCLIIDDEKQSRNIIIEELSAYSSIIKIIGGADSASAAIPLIDDFRPDLVFMDIHLGDGSAFNVLEKISWHKFKLVFTTAHNEYALKAFDFNAMDYILKPISSTEIKRVIDRILNFEPVGESILNKNFLLNHKNAMPKRIAIPNSSGIQLINISDILRCEADGNYSKIYTKKKEVIVSSKTLKEFDSLLFDFNFERVHHSHLVNVQCIEKYLNKDSGYLQMIDGTLVPIAQRKKTYVISLLGKII
jgi:two-component system LytT family response regulator